MSAPRQEYKPTVPHRRRNQHEAITLKTMERIQTLASECLKSEEKSFSKEENALLAILKEVLIEAKDIESCDLPTDNPDWSAMVLIVQNQADYILGKSTSNPVKDFDPEKASILEKILKISSISKKLNAGNCQEKAFFAFDLVIKKLLKAGISSFKNTLQLELAYFDNHFIMLIDQKFVLDPWLNIVFPLRDETLNNIFEDFGKLRRYFVIDNNWLCYVEENTDKGNLISDITSTYFTFDILKQANQSSKEAKDEKKPSTSILFKSIKKDGEAKKATSHPDNGIRERRLITRESMAPY